MFRVMNVVRPLYEILVAALAEARKQREFEVIVGVYQAREDQEAS